MEHRRMIAKMAPGRHPKVDQKSIKNHPFSKICIFTILDTHFSVPKGSGGTPFAAKTQNFDKKHWKHIPTNILNESLGKNIGVSSPLIKDYVWVMICRHWYPEARKTLSEMQFPVLVACLVVCLLRHTIVASSPGLWDSLADTLHRGSHPWWEVCNLAWCSRCFGTPCQDPFKTKTLNESKANICK